MFYPWSYVHKARCHGPVARALGCGVEGRKFESCSGQKPGKLSLSTQQWMSTWLTSGMVKGGERRGLGSTFHMLCPRHDRWGSNTPLPRWPLGYGHLYLVLCCCCLFGFNTTFNKFSVISRRWVQCSSCPRHLTWYYTQSHYPDTGSTSPSSTP